MKTLMFDKKRGDNLLATAGSKEGMIKMMAKFFYEEESLVGIAEEGYVTLRGRSHDGIVVCQRGKKWYAFIPGAKRGFKRDEYESQIKEQK